MADGALQLSDESGEDSESYFADPGSSARYPAQRPADEQGYVMRRSLLEEGTQPEYIIPLGSADGVWGMIKRVGRFRSEGWLALWKGARGADMQIVRLTAMRNRTQDY